MRDHAPASGISLTDEDAAVVKGMLMRSDRQHDIAAWFGVNGGRIGEIAARDKFGSVKPAEMHLLPPPGPYIAGRDSTVLIQAILTAREALDTAEAFIRGQFSH